MKASVFGTLLLVSQLSIAQDWAFIPNMGQWDLPVLAETAGSGAKLYLEANALTWQFEDRSDIHRVKEGEIAMKDAVYRSHVYRMHFQGADPSAQITPVDHSMQKTYYNFFHGNDHSRWKGGVHGYGEMKYTGLYPGIDLRVYSSGGNFKYDLEISAGADPGIIRLEYDGADSLYLFQDELHISTTLAHIVEHKPVAWQIIKEKKVSVSCNYILDDNILSFHFPEGYDPLYPIIIDPSTLIFGSYSGSTSDNWGYSATYDSEGNLYGAGIVFGTGYPTVTGSFQTTYAGGEGGSFACDVSISKFTADGTDLVYSTYLGGSKNELPHSLAVDSSGQLIVYGTTGSDDFPMGEDAYDNSFGGGDNATVTYVVQFSEGTDIYLTKFTADGTDIIGSTYLGGNENDGMNLGDIAFNYGDHARGEVVTNAAGDVYVASCTYSSNFPVSPGAAIPALQGGQDGIVAHFNADLSSLVWSTYLGGSIDDGAYSIRLAPDGTFIVGGSTNSNDFPVTAGGLNNSFQGGSMDGFLVRLNATGTSILEGTYIGTDSYDQTFIVEVDEENNVYCTGQTSGSYPVTAGVYSNPGSSQYISKLEPDLSALVFSTVFGSGSATVNISPTAMLVDQCESVYVAGWGGTVNSGWNPATGSVSGMPVTADAFSTTTTGSDFYFIVFKKDLTDLLYATFYGSPVANDHVDGGTSRFDKKGVIYEAVCAGCGGLDDFPTTPDAWSTTNNSTNCNLGVIKYEFIYLGPSSGFSVSPDEGCAPLNASFTNSSLAATSYFWDFGDGTTSEESDPDHVYTEPGTYTIMLIALDPESCIPEDTVYQTVEVYGYPEALFDMTVDPFSPIAYNFTDQSVDAATWFWTFGDGSSSTTQNTFHIYEEPGVYTVCLFIENANGCPDTICQELTIDAVSQLVVPNAFSPNGDGYNDIFLPFNFSLIGFELKIWNRWGELVFESNDPNIGWDGTYKGIDQEMDTYVYTVGGLGEDGQDYFFKGNITLVR